MLEAFELWEIWNTRVFYPDRFPTLYFRWSCVPYIPFKPIIWLLDCANSVSRENNIALCTDSNLWVNSEPSGRIIRPQQGWIYLGRHLRLLTGRTVVCEAPTDSLELRLASACCEAIYAAVSASWQEMFICNFRTRQSARYGDSLRRFLTAECCPKTAGELGFHTPYIGGWTLVI
jgi:hypothetical protein